MPRMSRKVVQEARMRVLAYLAARARREPRCGTSFRAMESDLGISASRVRLACRALEAEGLLVVEHRFNEDGGQLSNAYLPTKLGLEALAESRRAERAGEARPAGRPRPVGSR